MFKKILIITALIAVIGVLVFGAVNRTQAKTTIESVNASQGGNGQNNNQDISADQTDGVNTPGRGNGGNGYGQGAGNQGTGSQSNLPAAFGELSAEEAAALTYMREEEKLAHDVYVTFFNQWGLPLFQNISQSEQTHTDAIKTLLERYNVSDPASGAVGVFSDPNLQVLYNELVTRGSRSLAEALKVGAAIEEIDILDLQDRLAQTNHADIQQVFNNLLNGSSNHLRAFASTLKTQAGETYQSQYLGAEAYQTITSTSPGNGNGGGRGRP